MANFKIFAARARFRLLTPEAGRSGDRQEGVVTAEFAVTVPAILMLLAILVSFFTLAVEQLRLNDVAFMSARAVARGEKRAVVEYRATALMGKEVALEISAESETTAVHVSCESGVASLPWLTLRLYARQRVFLEESREDME